MWVRRLGEDDLRAGARAVGGRATVDPAYSAEVADELDDRLVALLAADTLVVLDYGVWSKEDREHYERLAEANGATWRLVYLRAGPDVLRHRLEGRNIRSDHDPNAVLVKPRRFEEFLTRFHPPAGEGEEILEQT